VNADREELRSRIRGAYLGLAVGDAFGATTEFMTPNEVRTEYGALREIVGGGWLRIKPGRVTDDTEMAMALGNALLDTGGCDLTAVGDRFVEWMRSKPIDIGGTVRRGISRYVTHGVTEAEPSEYAAGNGAAMRNLPVVIATLFDDDAFVDWTLRQARLTHNNPLSDDGTLLLSELTRMAIREGQQAPLQSKVAAWIERRPEFSAARFKPAPTDGYIVHTVRIVLHFFFNTYDFESCLIGVVNQGGDADTNAALAGQLAGAFYGPEAIPKRWLKKLDPAVVDAIERQVEGLLALADQLATTSDR
jgi:ADP-ribosyl-[dinitrogen reductase] hydrolase